MPPHLMQSLLSITEHDFTIVRATEDLACNCVTAISVYVSFVQGQTACLLFAFEPGHGGEGGNNWLWDYEVRLPA